MSPSLKLIQGTNKLKSFFYIAGGYGLKLGQLQKMWLGILYQIVPQETYHQISFSLCFTQVKLPNQQKSQVIDNKQKWESNKEKQAQKSNF